MQIIIGYVFTCSIILLVLALASFIKRNKDIDNNISRKIVHVGVAFSWFIMYKYFGVSIHLLFVPLVTLSVNLASNLFNSFSFVPLLAENRDHGTYLYPLSMLIMAIITILIPDYFIAYGIGLFSMALGDGFASIIGNSINGKKYHVLGTTKSVAGCLTVLILTCIVAYQLSNLGGMPLSIIEIFIIGTIGMILEILGGKNIDNLTLPLGVSALSYLLMVVI